MTVVVYRDGVIAADTAVNWDGMDIGRAVKIGRHKNGNLIGTSGDSWQAYKFLDQVLSHEDPFNIDLDYTQGNGVMITPSGEIWRYEGKGWFTLDHPFTVLGCGREFAVGALEMGANAVQAVRIAIKCSVYCDFPIHVIPHEGRRRTYKK